MLFTFFLKHIYSSHMQLLQLENPLIIPVCPDRQFHMDIDRTQEGMMANIDMDGQVQQLPVIYMGEGYDSFQGVPMATGVPMTYSTPEYMGPAAPQSNLLYVEPIMQQPQGILVSYANTTESIVSGQQVKDSGTTSGEGAKKNDSSSKDGDKKDSSKSKDDKSSSKSSKSDSKKIK